MNSEILEIDALAEPTCAQRLQHNLARVITPLLQHEQPNQHVTSQLLNTSDVRWPRQKDANISADEPRLLGGHRCSFIQGSGDADRTAKFFVNREPADPDAIPIGIPGSKDLRRNMGVSSIPLGFQPTNTLYRRAKEIPNSHMGQYHSRGRTRETEEEDHIQVIIPSSKPDRSPVLEPPLKRQKLEYSHVSADGPMFDPRTDPCTEGYTVTRPDKSQRRSLELSNRSLTPGTEKAADPGRVVGEYLSVENRMRTEPHKARHRRSNNHLGSNNASATVATLDSDPIQDTSEPEVQYQRAEPAPRPKYMGTARPRASNHTVPVTSDVNEQRDSGQRSPYFNPFRLRRSLAHNMRDSVISKRQEGHEKQDKTLDEGFVSVDGLRRGGGPVVDLNRMSPDELTAPTTIGNSNVTWRPQSDALPSKSLVKSSSAQKGSVNPRNNAGLPSSNRRCTPSTGSKNKYNDKRISKQQTTHDGEKEASWSVDLESISTGGEVHRGGTLGLVFDDETKAFDVRENGLSLATKYPNLRIHLKKIQKVSHSSESTKVRVESSKCGTQDNTLDIQMRSPKDVYLFEMKLTEQEVKMVKCSGTHMDKIFNTRLLAQRGHLERTGKNIVPEPLSFTPLAMKNDARDSAEYMDELSESSDLKRRCGPNGAIDREPRKNRLSQGMQPALRQAKSGIIFEGLLGEGSAAANPEPFGDEKTGMRSRLRKNRNELNPHLRGSDIKSDLRSRKFEHSPPPLRYSVNVGLGPEWRKPLLYPKTGKKKISVDWIDLERLDEGEYLNDTLIAFYLRFLEHQLEEKSAALAKKIYFFNTFFFASLTNPQKGKKGINYEAVQKWTRSVDIFSYDYIVVPINESQHWYVAIICSLPALARSPDKIEDNPTEEELLLSPDEQMSSIPSPARNPSSRASVSAQENASVLNEIEDPSEGDPSASFADLTLDTDRQRTPELGNEAHAEQSTGDTSNLVRADQAILDGRVKGKLTESTTLEQMEALLGDANLKQRYSDPVTVQDQSPKAPACLKKRKRKSIPPIQRIDPTSPLIITFDSLGMTHPSTTRILKDYLLAEGNAKRAMEVDVSRIKGLTAKPIPQQNNYCDCGLFLLGYIDKFLDDPKDFISKIIGHKYDVEKDWPKLKPSDLRASMREQIQALHAEEEKEWREKAKKADKYHPKQSQNTPSPSKDTAQPTNPPEMSESIEQQLKSTALSSPKDPPSTRRKALEVALPIDGVEAWHTINGISKKSKRSRESHVFQDSSDPLHHEEREISAPQLQQEPSLVIIESQSDAAGKRPIIDSLESAATPSPKRRSISVEYPSEIQDSQPSSFQDLHAPVENVPETPPQQSSSMVEDQYSTDLECPTPMWGTELEKESEAAGRHPNTKIKNISERGRRSKPKIAPEIVEIDD